jgi:RecA/RadA recombinase
MAKKKAKAGARAKRSRETEAASFGDDEPELEVEIEVEETSTPPPPPPPPPPSPTAPPMAPTPPVRSTFDLAGNVEQGRRRLMELSDSLGRRWGARTAMPLHVAPVAKIRRLPFGILMLDWRSGGGLAIGRWNRLWGKKSTLKSTLCLRALRSAQNHCRHCKCAIVTDPVSGARDCSCPNPRWWLKDEADYSWLPAEAALMLAHGSLPEGAKTVTIKGEGKFKALTCPPPAHILAARAEAEAKEVQKDKRKKAGKKKHEPRDILFVEMFRCEPMRCLWLDSEQSIDEKWAQANGVDTSLVLLIGAEWAQQSLGSIEDAVLTREFDFVVIDSTSVLETKENIEKAATERPTVAARASVTGQFVRRLLSASFEGLTARYRPTILCTSQVSTHGIGYGQHAYLAPTDGNALEHALSLDVRMSEEGYAYNTANTKAIHGQFGFEITKNKVGGSPGATGSIRFWLHPEADHPVGDSDDLATVMSYARALGYKPDPADGYIAEGSGKALLTLYSKYITGQKTEFSRVGDCEDYLRKNVTVYGDLRDRVLARLRRDEANLEVAQQAPAPPPSP